MGRIRTRSRGAPARLWRGLVVVGLAATAIVALPATASAHAVLESTVPASGATVAHAPRSVRLHFDEAVTFGLGSMRIYDASGNRVVTPEPDHPDGKASDMETRLPALAPGSYVVTWRVISADSHPVQGAFTFAVQAVSTASNVTGLADRLLAAQGGSTVVGVAYAIDRFLVYVAFALLLGGVGFVAWCWPDGATDRVVRRAILAGWALLLATTVAGVLLQGVYAAGFPLADALRGSVIADVLRTRFGELWAARAVLLVVLAPVLHRLDRFDLTSTRARVGAGAMGAVLILTLGLAGHAGTGMLLWLAVPADLVHVGAMCLWVGGLAVLALRVLAPRPASLEPAVARFSRLALACVAALVATGLFRAWRQVGSVVALTSTDYGHLLIAKTAAVVVVVLIATRSRDLVRSRVGPPRDLDAQPLPVGPGAARAEPDRETKRRLRKLVGVEVVVVAVVLAITAVLVSAQPARTAVNRPFTALVKTPKVHWDVLVTPGREGRNDFHVTALKPSGVGQDVLGMTLELRERDRDIGPIDLKLTRLGPGHYFSPGVDVPFTGHWELDMKVRLTPFEEATGTVDVPIRR